MGVVGWKDTFTGQYLQLNVDNLYYRLVGVFFFFAAPD